MKDKFKFYDYYKLVTPSEDFRKEFKDSALSTGHRRGLVVRFEATHAGLFNLNDKFYLPTAMEDGTITFTSKREKPAKILKHHDGASDPVGRITGAQFVWTVPDALKMNKDVQIMTDKSASIEEQVEAAKSFMQSGIPFQDGWRGLGHMMLDGVILDQKTIEQIQDGRFDAVSTFFQPGDGGVYCSECGQNLKDEFCGHKIGKVYEDEDGNKAPCTWIPEKHEYQECSLVVFDADPLTTVEIMGDSVEDKEVFTANVDTLGDSSKDSFEFSFKDFKEDAPMAKPKNTLSDIEQKVADILKEFRPDMEDKARSKLIEDIVALEKDGIFHPEQEDAELDEETAIKYAVEDLETQDQKIDSDAIYADMEKELDELNMADKKLSTESRKKLSDSTFCGPDRSFPVPDCAHVTAARRLIGKYKGPGDKTTILACVNRKAKSLGCNSKNKDSQDVPVEEVQTMEMPTGDSLAALDNDQAQTLFSMAEAELIRRELKVARECSMCAESKDQTKLAVDERDQAREEMKDLAMQLKYLRVELRNQITDYAELVDQNLDVQSKLVKERVEKLSYLATLRGKFASVDEAKEGLSSTDLDKQEAVLIDGFDFADASKRLNDGTDHVPNGDKVDNPSNEDHKDGQDTFEGLSPTQKAIVENVEKFVDSGDVQKAQRYYGKMVSMGVIDDKALPFEKLSAKAEDKAE